MIVGQGRSGGGASKVIPENAAPNAVANVAAPQFVEPAERMWVSGQYSDRRTCPSTRCGVVGRLFHREAADVIERRSGWGRISQPYDAGCVNGRSEYVDEGNDSCTAANGIRDGRFAEWVQLASLTATRPPDPAQTASDDERPVRNSDDFAQYRRAFVRAASQLIGDGRCTAADFEEMGGWMKSTNFRNQPIYFTYCGGMMLSNKIYLNAATGRIFRDGG